MIHLLRHRLLAVLTVLAVLCGLAHQIGDRFAMHHHCDEASTCCRDHDADKSPLSNQTGKACDHALCSHNIVALIESPVPMLTLGWVNAGQVPERATPPPEVEPAAIDHPPQLA